MGKGDYQDGWDSKENKIAILEILTDGNLILVMGFYMVFCVTQTMHEVK